MSDYQRVNETMVVALWATRDGDTVGDAAAIITPAVLSMIADEVERQAVRLDAPPLGQNWPLEDPDPTPREAYLRGWKAASDTLRARAEALRLATKDTATSAP
jgi:hypothetical protein